MFYTGDPAASAASARGAGFGCALPGFGGSWRFLTFTVRLDSLDRRDAVLAGRAQSIRGCG